MEMSVKQFLGNPELTQIILGMFSLCLQKAFTNKESILSPIELRFIYAIFSRDVLSCLSKGVCVANLLIRIVYILARRETRGLFSITI